MTQDPKIKKKYFLPVWLTPLYAELMQIKAGKLKFGVPKVVFHNYTISKEGTEPKAASFINMQEPKDVHQLRAFLGCC